MRPIRVVVVDDHEIVRLGLRAMLNRERDIDVLGMAATGEEALDLIDRVRPDVAVIDFSLPGMSGIEVCEKINERHPEVPVVMISTFLDDDVIRQSIQAGAKAYVYKDVEGRELKKTIRGAANGQVVLDPAIVGRVMRGAITRRYGPGERALSGRETEVLRLVAGGSSNPEIAKAMVVSENTVKTYLRRAMEKLGCHTRSEAAVAASRRGLL